MTEFELVTLLTEARDRGWVMIQIWSGVSFGYMAYAQFSESKLNLFFVTILSTLYVSFSVLMFKSMSAATAVAKACELSLRELAAETPLTPAAEAFFAAGNFGVVTEVAAMVAIFGTTACAFLYLPYVYIRSRGENT